MKNKTTIHKLERPTPTAMRVRPLRYAQFVLRRMSSIAHTTQARNKKAMPQQSTSQRSWFLKDEPLSNLQGQDRFSHNAYVKLLARTIDELTPPFTIGIFGSWGVGKSSIVNDLTNKLGQNSSGTRAVTIDVWKYSDDSLRRQFLYDLQQDLHRQNLLPSDPDYVQGVYEEKTEERAGKQRFDITRLRTLGAPLTLVSILTGGVIGIAQVLGIPVTAQPFLAAFVAPLVLYFVSEFSRSVMLISKETVTHPVYFSEDQFERKFKDIVTATECEKLVIIVDNLDRCSHELVVDTLSTIKTFLEPKAEGKCIFVIPCDDIAIRQHVKAAYRVISDDSTNDGTVEPEEYALEYLRKFFNGSVKIDPFLPEEIESYIKYLLSQMKLAEDMPDEEVSSLVQMVGFLFCENPRQLKQFLNNLTSKYLLVREREAPPSPQINPPIAHNRLFLAKVVAIETQFPDFYRRFRDDDNLFLEVRSAMVNLSGAETIENLLGKGDRSVALQGFLRATSHIDAENPKAFFHLKQSEEEARIPNFTQFRSALRSGDREEARRAYDKGGRKDNTARTGILIRAIADWSQKGYDFYALNAIRVAVALRSFPTADGRHISREIVRVLATTPTLLGKIDRIRNPNAIFEMAQHALPRHRHTVQDAQIEYFRRRLGNDERNLDADPEFEDSIVETFVTYLADLSDSQKTRLRESISASNKVRPQQLRILSSTQAAREALIELTALHKAVGNIDPEEIATFSNVSDRKDNYDATFQTLIRCQELGDQPLGEKTAGKLSELLEYAGTQRRDAVIWYVCKVASKLIALLQMAEPDHLDKIISQLCQQYQSGQPEQKAALVELLCRFYGRSSDKGRGQIDHVLFGDHILSLPAKHIVELLALHKEPSLATVPWERIIGRLTKRLLRSDGTEAKELVKLIVSELVPEDYELLMALAKTLLERPEMQRTIPLVGSMVASLPRNNKGKGLAAPIFEATLSLSDHAIEPENKKLLLDLSFRHHTLHIKNYKSKLDDHILDLATGSDSMKEVGSDALESGYAKKALPEERYVALLYRFASWLVQEPTMTPLEAPTLKWLDKIVTLEARLPEADSRRYAVIKWISDRQDESLPLDERRKMLRHLASFKRLPKEILHDFVPKAVFQIENCGDEAIRDAMLGTLVDLFRDNDPTNRALWSALYDYKDRLLASDDTERTLGRKLDDVMRKFGSDARRTSGRPK